MEFTGPCCLYIYVVTQQILSNSHSMFLNYTLFCNHTFEIFSCYHINRDDFSDLFYI